MTEKITLDTSVPDPLNSKTPDIKVEPATPPIPAQQTCASENCIHKPKNKMEDMEEEKKNKKRKQKKKKKKDESDSDSSDSDESSTSSDSSDSEDEDSDSDSSSSSSDSSASENEKTNRKSKKTKSKTKQATKKSKNEKEKSRSSKSKGKKSRQLKTEDSDDSSEDNSGDESSSDGLGELKRELASRGLLNSSGKRGNVLRDLLNKASKKSADDDAKSSKSKKSQRSSKTSKTKSDKKGKKTKEADLSKAKYKRLDEIWDDTVYDYRLRETSDKKRADQWEKYIFTVRRKFDCENHYQSTVVDIKSVPLRECLKVVMEGVQGVSLVERTPRLLPDMLFLYLEDFREYMKVLAEQRKKCDDKKAKKTLKLKYKHLEVLVSYLDKDYDEMKKTLYPMLENGTITFELLWALYKPNTLAYQATYKDETQPRAFRIDFAFKERDYVKGVFYQIEGKYMDYDGEHFGWAYIDAEVPYFQGSRKITSLACYPLKYHHGRASLEAKLIDRGKKFLALAGMNYKLCKGICYLKKDCKILKANVSGRVMIDPKTFRRINPNYHLSEVDPRDLEDDNQDCRCEKKDQPKMPKRTQDRLFMIQKKEDEDVEIIEIDSKDERAPENISDAVKKAEAAKLTFSEEELLLASPVLPGFCFSEKLWLELSISTISEVQWNEGAFDSLVIPEKHKAIVKALVSAHGQHTSKSIDDVVSGKGKGLVAVLHGKPGLGKTLTCEAVSDLLKRPLYSVSAGDLGTGASGLEYQLQVILDVAHTWGAVLLLDEADVFLEERSTHDVQRNALVSIFLRLLEYFQGILFLTTNRVETFDEAFVSRIHLSLRYGELTMQARKTIWKTFIDKVAGTGTPAPSSTIASDASSAGMPTPDTTSSTPNSGAATPSPSTAASADPPATPTTEASASSISIDSNKTVTSSSPKKSDEAESSATDKSETKAVAAVEKITEGQYSELARVELNGRQIKNLVKTAQALALYEGVPMGMGHLKRCIDVGRSFELDLKGGRGWEDAMRSYT